MTKSLRLSAPGFLCALLLSGSVHGQTHVKHRTHHYDLGAATDKASKSQTMDPTFVPTAPLGFPRNGVAFQIDYTIWFVADDATENIDYFAFHAPSDWTITAIGSAPASSAAECTDGDPHASVTSGFSATSAYWGGDYGGSVVTPGTPASYPDINNRSGCGPFDTATDSTSAHGAGLFHTFSVTMTPLAPASCPGSTTGALPLCCSGDEVSAGGPPPSGSEPYFNEMIAASDGNAEIFGDGFYYVSVFCPSPLLALIKFPLDAPVDANDCAAASPAPDTLTVPVPPGESAQYCYVAENLSNLISDPWFHVGCDSVGVDDDVLGNIFSEPASLPPGGVFVVESSSVSPPAVGECARNIGDVGCGTSPGSDYFEGTGIVTTSNLGFSEPDSAWICSENSLPVELAHFGVKIEDRDVVLEWITASETNNAGFTIEHRLADEPTFREVGFVDGAGTSETVQNYSFRITDPGPGRHAVRLKQIDFDGAISLSSQLLVEVEVPGEYYLTAAYPNPFTTSSTVEFAVPSSQDVTVELIDVQGRPVRTIFDGRLEANARYKATVDASSLASGTYFLRMNGERFQASETVTIAK